MIKSSSVHNTWVCRHDTGLSIKSLYSTFFWVISRYPTSVYTNISAKREASYNLPEIDKHELQHHWFYKTFFFSKLQASRRVWMLCSFARWSVCCVMHNHNSCLDAAAQNLIWEPIYCNVRVLLDWSICCCRSIITSLEVPSISASRTSSYRS